MAPLSLVSRRIYLFGCRVSPKGLAVSAATKARFVERVRRLYEQHAGGDNKVPSCVGKYVRRWLGWLRAAGEIEMDGKTLIGDLSPPAEALLHAELQ
jgi:hypothetical protein